MRRLASGAVGVSLVLAGCGGGSGEPRERRDSDRVQQAPVPGGGSLNIDPKAMREFEDCLRANGVEPPAPGAGEFAPPPRDAMEKCREHLPGGGEGPTRAPLPQSPGP